MGLFQSPKSIDLVVKSLGRMVESWLCFLTIKRFNPFGWKGYAEHCFWMYFFPRWIATIIWYTTSNNIIPYHTSQCLHCCAVFWIQKCDSALALAWFTWFFGWFFVSQKWNNCDDILLAKSNIVECLLKQHNSNKSLENWAVTQWR